MNSKHLPGPCSPGPWSIKTYPGQVKTTVRKIGLYAMDGRQEIAQKEPMSSGCVAESLANFDLMRMAPDMHDMILALTKYDWTVRPMALYDEEGVEGWLWTEPSGSEHSEIGDWNELPAWPDSARQAIAKLEGRK